MKISEEAMKDAQVITARLAACCGIVCSTVHGGAGCARRVPTPVELKLCAPYSSSPPAVPPTETGCMRQINIAFRDHCAHKLVDLNECRRENYYLPWTCQHEKHSYEKCQYKEYD